MKRGFAVFALAACLVLCASLCFAQTWNLSSDWSSTANPNGAWAYRWQAGGNQYLLGWSPDGNPGTAGTNVNGVQGFDQWSVPTNWWWDGYPIIGIQKGPGVLVDGLPAGTVVMHPNQLGWQPTVAWTAPANGDYVVNADFSNANIYTSTDVHIGVATGGIPGYPSVSYWPTSLPNYTEYIGSQLHGNGTIGDAHIRYNGIVTLKQNDTLMFFIGYGDNGNYYSDLTALNLTISVAPSTVAHISGTVALNTDDKPVLANATVKIAENNQQIITGSDGKYTLTVLPGTYTITASRSGLMSLTKTITVGESENATLDFDLNLFNEWNLSNDWSSTTNPNGAWAYRWQGGTNQYLLGWAPGGTPGTAGTNVNGVQGYDEWQVPTNWWWDGYPIIGKQKGPGILVDGLPVGTVVMHPNQLGWQPTVAWTAPSSGEYVINSKFTNAAAYTSTDIHVGIATGGIPGYPNQAYWATSLPNYSEYTSAQLHGSGTVGDTSIPFNRTLTLNANDTLMFFVSYGDNGNYYGDLTALDLDIKSKVGRTFYVKPDGDDTKSGLSVADAWKTIDNGDKKYILAPGDTVIVEAGSYPVVYDDAGTVKLKNCGGLPGYPITYKANGRVLLDFNNEAAHQNKGFVISGSADYITLDGFEFKGSPSGIYSNGVSNITVQNCYMHDMFACYGSNFDMPLVIVGGSDHVIKNNVIWDLMPCQTSGLTATGVYLQNVAGATVTNNVIGNIPFTTDGAPAVGIFLDGYSTGTLSNVKVENNTIVNCHDGISNSPGASGNSAINNIIVDCTSHAIENWASSSTDTIAHDYNLYNNNIGDYNDHFSAIQDAHKFTGDPLFVNKAFANCRLKAGSPAIDKGTDVGILYSGAAPDLGAYEYSTATSIDTGNLGDVKNVPDYTGVTLTDYKTATVDYGSFNFIDTTGSNPCGYIEEPLRYAGMKIVLPAGSSLAKNDSVKLSGDIVTDADGQRVLRVGQILNNQPGTEITPMGISNKSMFGSGPAISGLLVKVWGKVTFINATDYFNPMVIYVDDGSGMSDGAGVATGVRALLPLNIGSDLEATQIGDTVAVSGIASFELVNGQYVPVIRMRDGDFSNFTR